jgi:hypothetical protein
LIIPQKNSDYQIIRVNDKVTYPQIKKTIFEKKEMKKLVLILLSPLFLAFQCEEEPCMREVIQQSKPELITIENLHLIHKNYVWFL